MSSERKVPFFDFRAVFAEDPEGFSAMMAETLARGGMIMQPPLETFEQALADFLGCRFAVGTSDCTNAMTLGMRALELPAGSEVIVSSHTFLATAQAVHFAGLKAVPVEMQADRMIDPDAIEAAVGPNTRAVLITQLNGRTCAMDRIDAVAERHGLIVAEDSAQAMGSSFAGRRAGAVGRFGAFSFYPSKVLGGFGDGGAFTTDDAALADRVRRMRNHGADAQKQLGPECKVWGTNARLDTLHAAILLQKLPGFPATVARRRQIARTYHAAFEAIDGFGLPPGPDEAGPHFDVYQNYEVASPRRNELRAFLTERGVGTILQWGGVAIHHFRALGFTQDLPRTDAYFEQMFLLPMNQYLADEDVLRVASQVRAFHGLGAWTKMAAELPGDAPDARPSSGGGHEQRRHG